MKNILKYISLLFLGAAAVSCDFEDMPFDKYDSDFVFSNDKKAEGYVLGVYLGLPFDKSDENGYNRVDGAMLASASDEAMITVPGSSIVFLTDGSLTPRKAIPTAAGRIATNSSATPISASSGSKNCPKPTTI